MTAAAAAPRSQRLMLLLASTMTVMAGATIAPCLPAIARHFADVPGIELWSRLVLTLPALLTAVGAPLAGAVIDRFGRLRLLIAATALYGLAGAAGGLADSIGLLLASRALLGLAVGAIMTTTITLIADYYQGAERNRVMGQQAAFMGLGGVVLVTLGGALADLSWRAPFATYGLAFVFLPLIVVFLPEPESPSNLDVDPATVTDRRDLPRQAIAMLYVVAFLAAAAFYTLPVELPFHLGRTGQVSGARIGLALAVINLVSALVSLTYGRLRTRLSVSGVFLVLFGFMGAGFAVIAVAGSYTMVLAGLVVCGFGTGLLFPNLSVGAGALAPAAMRGRIVGGLTTAIFLGQFCSPLASQPLIARLGSANMYAAVAVAMAVIAALFGAASIRRRFAQS